MIVVKKGERYEQKPADVGFPFKPIIRRKHRVTYLASITELEISGNRWKRGTFDGFHLYFFVYK
jgi:hypothetical protein